jgi:hypothetical protein
MYSFLFKAVTSIASEGKQVHFKSQRHNSLVFSPHLKLFGYDMTTSSSHSYVVLTGDLVGSRKLSSDQLQTIFEGLKDFWGKFSKQHPDQIIGDLEVFRGDGWQVALHSPELALEAAVFLRAVGKACPLSNNSDSRVGIGIGSVNLLKPEKLGESQGKAFEASGDALKEASSSKVRWKLISTYQIFSQFDSLVLPLLDMAVSSWSASESIAVIGELLEWKQEDTAAHAWALKKDGMPPTQQAIGDALGRIRWKSHLHPVLKNIFSTSLGACNE